MATPEDEYPVEAAWIGLALMVANTAIALVDLFLLAGGIPR